MSEVIQVEENNVKALYLRGKAYIQRGELLLAYKDFQKASTLEPNNETIVKYFNDLKAKVVLNSSNTMSAKAEDL